MSESLESVFDAPVENEVIEPVEPAGNTGAEAITTEATGSQEAVATAEDKAAIPVAESADSERIATLEREVKASYSRAADEKGKRQAMAARLEEMQNPVELPDAYVDPQLAIDHAVREATQGFNQRLLNMSEQQNRNLHDDFDAMKDKFFNDLVIKNPSLMAEANQQLDPYAFVYQTSKNHEEMKGFNSVGDLRESIEQEVTARLEAEYADKANKATEQAITDAIPQSLAGRTAGGGAGTAPPTGAAPLQTLFGD